MRKWNHMVSPIEFQSEGMQLEHAPLHSLQFWNSWKTHIHMLPMHLRVHLPRYFALADLEQKSVAELSEEEQIRLAMEASLGGPVSAPIVIDDDEEDEVQEIPSLPLATRMSLARALIFSTVCKNIKAIENVEPPPSSNTTRIQFRLPDGTRKVRNFNKSDLVRVIFEYVKTIVPEALEKPFEVRFRN